MHIIVPANISYYCFCTLANIFPLHGIPVNVHLTFKKFDQLSQLACNCPSLSRILLVLALKVQDPWNTFHPRQTRIVRSTFRTKPNDLHSFSALSAHSLECTLELVTLQNCFTTECLKPTVSANILKNTIPFTLLYTKKKKSHINWLLPCTRYFLYSTQIYILLFFHLDSVPGASLIYCHNQSVSLATLILDGFSQWVLGMKSEGGRRMRWGIYSVSFHYQRPYSIFSHLLQ